MHDQSFVGPVQCVITKTVTLYWETHALWKTKLEVATKIAI